MNQRQLKTTSIQIELEGNYGQIENIDNKFYCVGRVFFGEQELSANVLFQHVKQSLSEHHLTEFLQELNGFYAFIYVENDTVYAVTDRLRSRPLFYSVHEKTLFLSDSVTWLNKQFSGKSTNEQGEMELVRAGYISGGDTLITEVKQIEAGTLLSYSNEKIDRKKYYNFLPQNGSECIPDSTLFEQLDSSLKKSIDRLISLADGRQIVIPLSGGYDSRIIALYLKQTDYKNITTFTFGTKNSPEVNLSHNIATGLALPWHFVEYTRRIWNREKRSEEFKAFLLFISSFTSVPNVQVYPAIKALLQSGVIEPNAIIVPGHTGDFSSGGHMPEKLLHIPAQGNTRIIVDAITAKHYRSKSPEHLDKELTQKISSQVDALIEALILVSDDLPAASLFEAWEFNERQAKFIVNSNRYYDYWKLDWWMPLWDNQLISFWQLAPLANRQQSNLWQAFINLKSREMLGESAPQGNAAEHFSPFWRRTRSILDYFTHHNGLYALVPLHRWLLRKMKFPNANGTVFSYLAEQISRTQKKQIK